MSPKFVFRESPGAAASTPEELFADLKRPGDGPTYLWSHQADVLRSYHSQHLDSRDIALELPTGSGKTLVGQLIGEWRRRARRERVAYLCPTVQLVHQTAAQAKRNGIAVVTLMEDHHHWPSESVQRFHASEAMAITTYSTIFNSAPKLDNAQVLILDDAHAGESYVAGAWSLQIPRSDSASLLPQSNPLYHAILDIVDKCLDPVFVKMMRDDAPDPAWYMLVEQVPPEHLYAHSGELFAALKDHAGDHRYPLTRVGGHLGACMAFIGWTEILIRPLIPPTASLDAFSAASQRLYMSATLGESGELERSFGRPKIRRLPVPRGWESHGAGRRLFVFTEMVTDAEGIQVARDVVQSEKKALLLSPDERTSQKSASAIAGDLPILDKNNVKQSMNPFAKAPAAVLALTGRYDGIDLPGADCRVVVLNGLPAGVHLQERFMVKTLGAGRALQERIRTRVVQGAGRCTRNPQDFAVVLIVGRSLTNFCGQAEVQNAMHPEIQAEISFGWDNSRIPAADMVGMVRSFLGGDPEWKDEVEPRLAERRARLQRVLPAATGKYGKAAPDEVHAIDAAWSGAWSRAVEHAKKVATELAGSEDTRAYQALWLFLGSQWAAIGAAVEKRPELAKVSEKLLEQAISSAPKSAWMNRAPANVSALADAVSESLIAGAIARFGKVAMDKPTQFEDVCVTMLARINGTAAKDFELGLQELGKMLGFGSVHHADDSAPDVEWSVDSGPWITVEAKSDESPQGEIGTRTVDQANRHLRWMAAHRRETVPPGSLSIIATPRVLMSTTASDLAQDFVRVADIEEFRELADDAVSAWREIRGRGAGLKGEDLVSLVRERFERNGILGATVFQRLHRRQPSELVRQP
jgi:hypothetical protein